MDLGYYISRAAAWFGSREALVAGRTRRTFSQVESRSNRLANALLGMGLGKGQRVGILLRNCAEFVEIDFALAKAGLVRVALNARLRLKDHLFMLSDARAAALIYGAEFAGLAEELRRELTDIRHWVGLGGAGGPGEDYESLLIKGADVSPGVANRPADLFSLFYTSGTTGRPKGVMHTHQVMASVGRNLLLECFNVTASNRALLIQPLSHGSGFFTLPAFMRGACSVLLDRFDPEEVMQITRRERVSVIKLIPTMLINLLDGTRASPEDRTLVRSIIYGASPMPVERLREALERFGPVFTQIYGQAEAPATISVLTAEEHRPAGTGEEVKRLGSAGRPFLPVRTDILGPDEQPLRPGELGELVVESDHVMSGYWNRPELTAAVLKNGRIYTRDMATMDERGFIYLVGRADDVINSGGFNVAPREVEEVLQAYPAVAEAAVIGVPHPTWGQAVHACVVLKAGMHATELDLIEFTRSALGFRHPRGVSFLPSLPKNPYGKVQRSELLDKVKGELQSAVRKDSV